MHDLLLATSHRFGQHPPESCLVPTASMQIHSDATDSTMRFCVRSWLPDSPDFVPSYERSFVVRWQDSEDIQANTYGLGRPVVCHNCGVVNASRMKSITYNYSYGLQ
jgi:hypothetical protein